MGWPPGRWPEPKLDARQPWPVALRRHPLAGSGHQVSNPMSDCVEPLVAPPSGGGRHGVDFLAVPSPVGHQSSGEVAVPLAREKSHSRLFPVPCPMELAGLVLPLVRPVNRQSIAPLPGMEWDGLGDGWRRHQHLCPCAIGPANGEDQWGDTLVPPSLGTVAEGPMGGIQRWRVGEDVAEGEQLAVRQRVVSGRGIRGRGVCKMQGACDWCRARGWSAMVLMIWVDALVPLCRTPPPPFCGPLEIREPVKRVKSPLPCWLLEKTCGHRKVRACCSPVVANRWP